jgi:hypothetical protein
VLFVEGLLSIAFYLGHAATHLVRERPRDLLWACHIACLCIGAGALLGRPTAAAVGVCWLALGIPLWILDLSTGGELIPTSFLTHVGGAIVGARVVRKLGFPRGTWWKATVGIVALQEVSRLVGESPTHPSNVNLAFHVHHGWEGLFPTYARYFVVLLALFTLVFYATETIARRLVRTPSHGPLASEGT